MAKLLIVTSTGPEDPTRASIPFHIAVNGRRGLVRNVPSRSLALRLKCSGRRCSKRSGAWAFRRWPIF
jgi:hypothetical protein